METICKHCGNEKEIVIYKHGKRSVCRLCKKNLNVEYFKNNKATVLATNASNKKKKSEQIKQLITELKSVPCADCKQTFPTCAMDFDHQDGYVKWKAIGAIHSGGYSIDRIKQEIAKCQVVCANCHRIRTEKQRLKRLEQNNKS